jgi:DNA repair photolyase
MRVRYREEPCRSALNAVAGMDFEWSLNPYMGCVHRCAFCYVRGFEHRAERPSDDRYGTSIRVKINIAEVLRAELARPTWKRSFVLIGAATDPYQPAEGTYRLTRGCLEALAAARTPFGLITRGTLIVRDTDVLVEASRRAKVSISFSIPTLDEQVWRVTEPTTPHPRQRLRALRRLVDAGVKAGVAMAPLLPGLSDAPEKIETVVQAARDAGAVFIWGGLVNLRPGTREHFLTVLDKHWPELVPRYQDLFGQRSYLPREMNDPVSETVKKLRRKHGIADRRVVRHLPPEEPSQMMLDL